MIEPLFLKNPSLWQSIIGESKNEMQKVTVHCARLIMLCFEEDEYFDCVHRVMEQHNIGPYQAGVIADIIFRCHNQGEDFKNYWNKYFNVTMPDGVVNPVLFLPDEEGIAQ